MEDPKLQENIQESVQEFQLPEWETTARHHGKTRVPAGHKLRVKERVFLLFDNVIPPHKKYLGFTRRVGCIAVLVGLLILLALILGLAIGLSRKSRYTPYSSINTRERAS